MCYSESGSFLNLIWRSKLNNKITDDGNGNFNVLPNYEIPEIDDDENDEDSKSTLNLFEKKTDSDGDPLYED